MQQSLGKALRAVRLAKGLSQEQVSQGANLTRSYITNIENGHRDPSLSTIGEICKSLGVPMTTIVILSEAGEYDSVKRLLPYAIVEMV